MKRTDEATSGNLYEECDINVAISFSCMEIHLYVVCGHMYTVISLILMNEWTFF